MAYYIISLEPDRMKTFQKRFSFLADAAWIKDKESLYAQPPSLDNESFYFVQLIPGQETIDEIVLEVRETLPDAKLIYVVEDGKLSNQKSHQLTPVGGDGYLSINCNEQTLIGLLESLRKPDLNQRGNRLEGGGGLVKISSTESLDEMREHPKSKEIDLLFQQVFKKKSKPAYVSAGRLGEAPAPDELELGDLMSDKDQELSLEDLGELELSDEAPAEAASQDDGGLDLSLDDAELDLGAPDEIPDSPSEDQGLDLDLGDDLSLDASGGDSNEAEDEELSLSDDSGPEENFPDLDLGGEEEAPDLNFGSSDELSLSADDSASIAEDADLNLSDDLSGDIPDLDLSGDLGGDELSDDARKKLEEIDAIMVSDASQVGITLDDGLGSEVEDFNLGESEESKFETASEEADIDKSLVSDDLDLGSISFGGEEEATPAPVAKESKKKTKEVQAQAPVATYDGDIGRDLKEVSAAYSGEMERLQATISNLRTDREELLARIQKLEEDKILQSRQTLTIRAELDEKKIELSIIRKKLNDEITELKDRLKLQEERKLILEEKNKILMVELDKAAQKNKIDVKKVQMRERELEQKLELLKSDSELQIRNRDLKILELKRKIDAMEFDMESISMQEKRSVESRFELEDKLDKAIKTLRSAISVLEDENQKSNALEALKKNIDM